MLVGYHRAVHAGVVAVAAVVVVRFGLPPPTSPANANASEATRRQGLRTWYKVQAKEALHRYVRAYTNSRFRFCLQASTRKHAHTTHCCPLAPWLAYRARPFERGNNSAGGPLFTVDGGARGENGTVG